MKKKCLTCGREFHPVRNQEYCISSCRPVIRYKKLKPLEEKVKECEKEIKDLKWYKLQYRRVKEYILENPDPDYNFIKNNILTL